MQKIAEWHRGFQVWQYSVSHSTLLLRSVNVAGFSTRIDVVFVGVELMLIRPTYSKLIIFCVEGDEKREILVNESEEVIGKQLFLLDGKASYVVAGGFSWHEDAGDHHTPSRFGPLRGTE
ncbi:hypothetical protein AB0395_38595 [Streptosporangium sp. NPDC051023]|uniref:hypothetical protein n=1 Tax=Streptosporangium sp. NPDC051023 TaxID=3155410 RepID=UPI00344C94C8